jgi:hypothetical protein
MNVHCSSGVSVWIINQYCKKFHLTGPSISYSTAQNYQTALISFVGYGAEGSTLKPDTYLHVKTAGPQGSGHGCNSAQIEHEGTFLVCVPDMADISTH